MQCAARSMPPQRSFPARRSSISFEPTLSVEAASSWRSFSGKSPAKRPKPVAPVDSTAVRRRSTTAFAVSSETPAASYVRASFVKKSSLGRSQDGQAVACEGDSSTRGFPARASAITDSQAEELAHALDEHLRFQLGPPLGAAGREAD